VHSPPLQLLDETQTHITDTTNAGAASGFGAAIATRFVQEGCRVMLADVNFAGAEEVARKLGGDGTLVIEMDVTVEKAWGDAVRLCVEQWGRLDVVVNNAGTTYKNKVCLMVFPFF
jgi:NADP-dependent 3-hydroxy acid dehydrogenase YdfG